MQANTYLKVVLAAVVLAATTTGAQDRMTMTDQAGQGLPRVWTNGQNTPMVLAQGCPETDLGQVNEQLLQLAMAMSRKAGNPAIYMSAYLTQETAAHLSASEVASARVMLLKTLGTKLGIQ